MAARLTDRHRDILKQIAEGWRPFPFQLSGLEDALIGNGLVLPEQDERGNVVLTISGRGQHVVAEAPKATKGGKAKAKAKKGPK